MITLDVLLLFGAIFSYTFAFIGHLVTSLFKIEKYKKMVCFLINLGFGFHCSSLIGRWYTTGHAPANVYELSVLAGCLAILIFLVTCQFYGKSFNLGLVIVPLILLQTGYGLLFLTPYEPLKPEYQSLWLTVHIIFAFVATGCYVLACAGAILKLMGYQSLPTPAVLEEFNARVVSMGFVSHFLMIGTGAIWAQEAWGSYWGWDPIETWSLITWIIYGLFLHLYYMIGLKGKRMDWFVVGCFVLVIICYWTVPHIPIKNFAELYGQ